MNDVIDARTNRVPVCAPDVGYANEARSLPLDIEVHDRGCEVVFELTVSTELFATSCADAAKADGALTGTREATAATAVRARAARRRTDDITS